MRAGAKSCERTPLLGDAFLISAMMAGGRAARAARKSRRAGRRSAASRSHASSGWAVRARSWRFLAAIRAIMSNCLFLSTSLLFPHNSRRIFAGYNAQTTRRGGPADRIVSDVLLRGLDRTVPCLTAQLEQREALLVHEGQVQAAETVPAEPRELDAELDHARRHVVVEERVVHDGCLVVQEHRSTAPIHVRGQILFDVAHRQIAVAGLALGIRQIGRAHV